MRYKDFRIVIERTSNEDPNSWSNRDLGSVLDYINLNNAAFDRDYDLPSDDPIAILGLVGDPKLGLMKKWQEFAGEPTDKDTRVKKTQTKMQVDSAAYYDTQSKDLVQNATLVNDKIAAFIDDGGLVHESIHRGLAMIRDLRKQGLQLSNEANQWLDNEELYIVDRVQASVDHCMIRSIIHGDGAKHCEVFYKQDPQAQEFFNRRWRSSFNDRYVDLTPSRADTRFIQGEPVLGKDREPEEPITDFAEQMRFYFVTLYNDISAATGKFLKTPRFTSPVRPKLRPGTANDITASTIEGDPSVQQWLASVATMLARGSIQDTTQTRAQLEKDVQTLATRHAEPDFLNFLFQPAQVVDRIFQGSATVYSITGKIATNTRPQQSQAGQLELYIRSVRDQLKTGTVLDSNTVKNRISNLTSQPVDNNRLNVFVDQLINSNGDLNDSMLQQGIAYLLAR